MNLFLLKYEFEDVVFFLNVYSYIIFLGPTFYQSRTFRRKVISTVIMLHTCFFKEFCIGNFEDIIRNIKM